MGVIQQTGHALNALATGFTRLGRGGVRKAREQQIRRAIDRRRTVIGEILFAMVRSGELQVNAPEVASGLLQIRDLERRLDELRARGGDGWVEQRSPEGPDRGDVAAQDAGWVELLSGSGDIRYGRGHLKIWVDPTSPSGGDEIRAQLQSLSTERELPEGGPLLVHLEGTGESYPVTVRAVVGSPHDHDRVLDLNWMGELPASLRELGGA